MESPTRNGYGADRRRRVCSSSHSSSTEWNPTCLVLVLVAHLYIYFHLVGLAAKGARVHSSRVRSSRHAMGPASLKRQPPPDCSPRQSELDQGLGFFSPRRRKKIPLEDMPSRPQEGTLSIFPLLSRKKDGHCRFRRHNVLTHSQSLSKHVSSVWGTAQAERPNQHCFHRQHQMPSHPSPELEGVLRHPPSPHLHTIPPRRPSSSARRYLSQHDSNRQTPRRH